MTVLSQFLYSRVQHFEYPAKYVQYLASFNFRLVRKQSVQHLMQIVALHLLQSRLRVSEHVARFS